MRRVYTRRVMANMVDLPIVWNLVIGMCIGESVGHYTFPIYPNMSISPMILQPSQIQQSVVLPLLTFRQKSSAILAAFLGNQLFPYLASTELISLLMFGFVLPWLVTLLPSLESDPRRAFLLFLKGTQCLAAQTVRAFLCDQVAFLQSWRIHPTAG